MSLHSSLDVSDTDFSHKTGSFLPPPLAANATFFLPPPPPAFSLPQLFFPLSLSWRAVQILSSTSSSLRPSLTGNVVMIRVEGEGGRERERGFRTQLRRRRREGERKVREKLPKKPSGWVWVWESGTRRTEETKKKFDIDKECRRRTLEVTRNLIDLTDSTTYSRGGKLASEKKSLLSIKTRLD